MEPLFRPEAVAYATRRLDGEVLVPARLSVWAVLGVVTAILALGTWFAATATYARKETVVGVLSPEAGVVRAVAPRTGVVSELLVSTGDVVERNTPLARLGMPERSNDDGEAAVLSRTLAAQRRAHVDSLAATIRLSGLDAARLEERRASLRREAESVRKQMRRQAYRVSGAARDLRRTAELVDKGHLSRSDRDAAAAVVVDARLALSALTRDAEDLEREMSDVAGRIHAIPAAVAAAQAEMEGAVAGLDERIARLSMEMEQLVASPIAGRIDAVAVRAGQSVTSGSAIAVVVPVGEDLVADLYVPSRAVAFVAPGQPLRLKYEAFPFQRYGAQDGVVADVSGTVLSPEEAGWTGIGLEEPVFRVRGRLGAQSLSAYGTGVPLRAGMRLTADIVVDHRTLLEWLLDPLYAVGRR